MYSHLLKELLLERVGGLVCLCTGAHEGENDGHAMRDAASHCSSHSPLSRRSLPSGRFLVHEPTQASPFETPGHRCYLVSCITCLTVTSRRNF